MSVRVRSVMPHRDKGEDPVAPEQDEPFKPRCLSLDLEVGKEDGRIYTCC